MDFKAEQIEPHGTEFAGQWKLVIPRDTATALDFKAENIMFVREKDYNVPFSRVAASQPRN